MGTSGRQGSCTLWTALLHSRLVMVAVEVYVCVCMMVMMMGGGGEEEAGCVASMALQGRGWIHAMWGVKQETWFQC